MKYVLLIVWLAFVNGIVASKEEDIVWLTDVGQDLVDIHSLEPVSIATDTAILLFRALNGGTYQGVRFSIELQTMTIPRMDRQIKLQNNVCIINRIKTKERLAGSLFSSPVNIYPGYRLYFLPENAPDSLSALNERHQLVSLADYLNSTFQKTLGVSKGRSFGTYLDEQISLIDDKNLFLRAGAEGYYALTEMLFKRRVDYIIAFPTTIKERVQQHPSVKVLSLEIANTPPYIVGHIACNDSEVGNAFIEFTNATLHKLYKNYDFYRAHVDHLTGSDIEALNRYYPDVYNVAIPELPE